VDDGLGAEQPGPGITINTSPTDYAPLKQNADDAIRRGALETVRPYHERRTRWWLNEDRRLACRGR